MEQIYALGWAQMRSHSNLILKIYSRARGRSVEYWGEEFVDSDRYMRTIGALSVAEAMKKAGSFQDAFVDRMNAYAETHPDSLDEQLKAVLPLTAQDALKNTRPTCSSIPIGGYLGTTSSSFGDVII